MLSSNGAPTHLFFVLKRSKIVFKNQDWCFNEYLSQKLSFRSFGMINILIPLNFNMIIIKNVPIQITCDFTSGISFERKEECQNSLSRTFPFHFLHSNIAFKKPIVVCRLRSFIQSSKGDI